MTQDLTITALTARDAPHFFGFLEGEAFADNPQWAACFCRFPFVDHGREPSNDQDGPGNRADSAARIERGGLQGYLARDGAGKVVGWCNAGPSVLYPAGNLGGPDLTGERIGHILCFVVAPSSRRQGVARGLLAAACAGLKAQGMTHAQGNPRADAKGAAANHHGPLPLYLDAGFTVHASDDADGSLYVRKTL